jgi:hypothetical protein
LLDVVAGSGPVSRFTAKKLKTVDKPILVKVLRSYFVAVDLDRL